MKNIKKIGMMLVAGVALATTSCSDFADFNEAYTETDMRAVIHYGKIFPVILSCQILLPW